MTFGSHSSTSINGCAECRAVVVAASLTLISSGALAMGIAASLSSLTLPS